MLWNTVGLVWSWARMALEMVHLLQEIRSPLSTWIEKPKCLQLTVNSRCDVTLWPVPLREKLRLQWTHAGLGLRPSQVDSRSVFQRERAGEGWAGSVNVWQLCAWHPDNTPCDWHTHTHTHRKQGRVRGHERVRQTSTTRKRSGRKDLVDSGRQKWEREVDLSFHVLVKRSVFVSFLSVSSFLLFCFILFSTSLTLILSHLSVSLFLFLSLFTSVPYPSPELVFTVG